ncbi:Peptide methionine sulfoxide reductase B5, partial [Linum grandiflorum]
RNSVHVHGRESIYKQKTPTETDFIPALPFLIIEEASMAAAGSVQKTEEEWRAILNPEQFRILREKGTELKFTGEYDKLFEEGVYSCAGCGTPLYKSATKFNSGCGWPAFFDGLPGAINRSVSEKLISRTNHLFKSDRRICLFAAGS